LRALDDPQQWLQPFGAIGVGGQYRIKALTRGKRLNACAGDSFKLAFFVRQST
jgi:hypothetical protein